MSSTQEEYKKAKIYTDSRFQRVKWETTYTSRCYEEWYEIWATKDCSPVTDQDIEAFKLQPRGQGHGVERFGETHIRLNCVCDSGD